MHILRAILGLPPGGSSFARDIDRLHVFVITVTMLGAVWVFCAAVWFTIRYAKRRTAVTRSEGISTAKELALVGGLLALFLAWWILGYVQYVHMQTPPADARVVYVTAKQWMWKFEYPEGTSSNDVLVVPAGRKVKLVMTSRDVIHSFFVPGFRVKQDVLPGRYTTLWFEATEGKYPIWCAEYCGAQHSLMAGEVQALGPAEYANWLRDQTEHRPASMAQRGLEVAAHRGCLACHTLDGQRHVGPTFSRLYGSKVKLADGREITADEAYLTRSMMEPQAELVAGFAPVMPTYIGQLSPSETTAIVQLIESLGSGGLPTGVALPHLDIRLDGGTP